MAGAHDHSETALCGHGGQEQLGVEFADFLIAGAAMIIILAFLGVGVSMQLFWVPVLMTILAFISMGMGILQYKYEKLD